MDTKNKFTNEILRCVDGLRKFLRSLAKELYLKFFYGEYRLCMV